MKWITHFIHIIVVIETRKTATKHETRYYFILIIPFVNWLHGISYNTLKYVRFLVNPKKDFWVLETKKGLGINPGNPSKFLKDEK
jgi:hypothetical protein